MSAAEELDALGYKLKRINGKFELWERGPWPCVQITFNVCDGRQVAKIQTVADHSGPLNSPIEVYQAMIDRMKERASVEH